MELFWVVTEDAGDVRWQVETTARRAGQQLKTGGDTLMKQITDVTVSGPNQVYKTVFEINTEYTTDDDVLAFTLQRNGKTDLSTGDVGLVGIRFVYKSAQ